MKYILQKFGELKKLFIYLSFILFFATGVGLFINDDLVYVSNSISLDYRFIVDNYFICFLLEFFGIRVNDINKNIMFILVSNYNF